MSHIQWFSGMEEGIAPLRLEEPITSLQLTPFALKAARTTPAKTVGQLASFVWQKEVKGLGQGHIDEIKEKIRQFVGTPPFSYEHSIDWASLLRLSVSHLENIDKAILVSYSQLQTLVPLSPQETREAQIVLQRSGSTPFQNSLSKAQKKTVESLPPLISTIFTSIVKPLIVKRGGIIHSIELKELLFEQGSIRNYPLFDRTINLLEALCTQSPLFSAQLFIVRQSFWTISPTYQRLADALLEEADVVLQKGNATNLHTLAYGLARCQMCQWEAWPLETIKRLLFWQYMHQSHL